MVSASSHPSVTKQSSRQTVSTSALSHKSYSVLAVTDLPTSTLHSPANYLQVDIEHSLPDCSRTAVGSPMSPAEEGSSSMAEVHVAIS